MTLGEQSDDSTRKLFHLCKNRQFLDLDKESKEAIKADSFTQFKNLKNIQFFKKVLRRPGVDRKKEDLARIARYLKTIPFFKYRDSGVITDQDALEIASALKFESARAGDKVVNFGD